MALPAMEEGKMLSEALNTVKIQVQQMKRHLVCQHSTFSRVSSRMSRMALNFHAGCFSLYTGT
jgi:hypothetical protein